MDPLTLAYASATVLLVGNLAQFGLRLMSDRKPPPVIGTEACKDIIKGKIMEHEVYCHWPVTVLERINAIARTTREDLADYRKDIAGRLETIEAKLDRHIDKGG